MIILDNLLNSFYSLPIDTKVVYIVGFFYILFMFVAIYKTLIVPFSYDKTIEKIKEYAEKSGYEVEIIPKTPTLDYCILGFWNNNLNKIVAYRFGNGSLDKENLICTLLHELGHAKSGHHNRSIYELTRELKLKEETEAWKKGERLIRKIGIRKPLMYDYYMHKHIKEISNGYLDPQKILNELVK